MDGLSAAMGVGSVSVRIGIVEWLGAWAWPSGMCRGKFGGPEGVVGKLVKLFGETRTVIRRWRNKDEAAFLWGWGQLGCCAGAGGAPRLARRASEHTDSVAEAGSGGFWGQEVEEGFASALFPGAAPPQSQHGPLA